MLNRHQQAALYHVREGAKILVPGCRELATNRIPDDRPLVFYEGMIETCMALHSSILHAHQAEVPEVNFNTSEQMVYGLLWALADLWEKKTGIKLKTCSLSTPMRWG